MPYTKLLEKTRAFVSSVLAAEPSSHDMAHIKRVEALCLKLQKEEGGELLVLRLAALLHDVGVLREHENGGDHALYSAEIASDFLSREGLSEALVKRVVYCIKVHRFSGGHVPEVLEAQILQDADRLDALGAIGVFRAVLSMGALRMLKYTKGIDKGKSKKTVYAPDPVDGFYEYMQYKPSKIPEKLNTETAKRLAEERLKTMHLFQEALKREAECESLKT
ncbi:MAG: HD domain-containing protein [Methanosarcinaceae archaeon]|nr:HD domain-containing protein [Methanosarcinaceae archaeon]MDD4749698.1 HD domain-containing protein [Methanosarcinaceae archaeon]